MQYDIGTPVSRTAGSRNADYDATRASLASALAKRLIAAGGPGASFRELAECAGVSVPTLRHYFVDRDGALTAAMASLGASGGPWLALTRDPGALPVAESLRMWSEMFVAGWRHFGVGPMQAAGLAAGLGSDRLGPAYLDDLLEPVQQALEARVAVHIERGELRDAPPRLIALQLLAPILVVLLHQAELGGERCRPLDVGAFLPAHLEAFLRAWGR